MRAVYRITVIEALRRRTAAALAGITLIIVALSGWGLSAAMQPSAQGDIISRLNGYEVLVFFLLILAGLFALTAILIAAPSLSTEIESHVILAELSRPVSRATLLLGKWLALSSIVGAFVVVMASAEMVVVTSIGHIASPHPVTAVAYLLGEALVLVALSVLLSTRLAPVTAGLVAMALYFLSWMAGVLGGLGQATGRLDLVHISTAFSLLVPSDQLWRGAVFSLEPKSLLNLALSFNPHVTGSPFLVFAPPTPAFIAWAFVWVVAVLAVAATSFRRREL